MPGAFFALAPGTAVITVPVPAGLARGRLRATVGHVLLLAIFGATLPLPALAQERDTTVSAAEQYGAGGLHRFFFGRHYRDLWTIPITFDVLNL